MKKSEFPSKIKFGTYLPQRQGMSYIKMSDCAQSLELFITEYFSDSVRFSMTGDFHSGDAVYIDGEYVAYIFRCVLSAFFGGEISVKLSSHGDSFAVSFSVAGDIEKVDTAALERLADVAELAGFTMSLCARTVSFSTRIVRGKLVISVPTRVAFYDVLTRVFFEN